MSQLDSMRSSSFCSAGERKLCLPDCIGNLPDGFAAFDLPHGQRVRLHTTNGLERINREIKRRTRVASIFPNAASCLRLVSDLLAECDEDRMTGKTYLNLKDRSHHPNGIAREYLQKRSCTIKSANGARAPRSSKYGRAGALLFVEYPSRLRPPRRDVPAPIASCRRPGRDHGRCTSSPFPWRAR